MQLSQQKSKGRSSTSNRVIFGAVTIVKYLSNASYWNHNLEKFDGVVLEIGRRKLYIYKKEQKIARKPYQHQRRSSLLDTHRSPREISHQASGQENSKLKFLSRRNIWWAKR
jgi:hypothetical protein